MVASFCHQQHQLDHHSSFWFWRLYWKHFYSLNVNLLSFLLSSYFDPHPERFWKHGFSFYFLILITFVILGSQFFWLREFHLFFIWDFHLFWLWFITLSLLFYSSLELHYMGRWHMVRWPFILIGLSWFSLFIFEHDPTAFYRDSGFHLWRMNFGRFW